MIFDTALISIFIPTWIVMATGLMFSFLITLYGIPSVVRLARIKKLYDIPGDRTSHETPTPRLGGAMVFAGVILSSVLFTGLNSSHELKYIIAGMIILFFIGIKDDVVSLSPLKKATGQFIAALILALPGDIHLTYINGLFADDILNVSANILLTVLIVMTLINSINFIDGIDGLAAGVGILSSLILGLWYMLYEQQSYAVMCFNLSGALIAFFYFNVFSKKRKIFLGDTGSMLIGFLLAVFVIRFLNLNLSHSVPVGSDSGIPSLALALAILFIPVFDTIRICIVRIYNGKSIFKPDSNHVHHRVLRMTGSHLNATLIMIFVNLVLIILTYLFRNLGDGILVIILICIGTAFALILGSD